MKKFTIILILLIATSLLHADAIKLQFSSTRQVLFVPNRAEKVLVETLRLYGADLQGAQVDFVGDNHILVKLPKGSWQINKVPFSDSHESVAFNAYDQFIEEKRLHLKFTIKPSFLTGCLTDRYEQGIIIACRVSQVVSKPEVPNIIAATRTLPKVTKLKSETLIRQNSKDLPSSSRSQESNEIFQADTKTLPPKVLTVEFLGSGNQSQIRLALTKSVKYQLAKVANQLYRLVIHDAVLDHLGLSLPYFAPQDFKGVNLLKITEQKEGLIADLQVDNVTVPKVVLKDQALVISF